MLLSTKLRSQVVFGWALFRVPYLITRLKENTTVPFSAFGRLPLYIYIYIPGALNMSCPIRSKLKEGCVAVVSCQSRRTVDSRASANGCPGPTEPHSQY